MLFCEYLNTIIGNLDCTSKELSIASGLSPATISRYRSGDRIPAQDSNNLSMLISGILSLAKNNEKLFFTGENLKKEFEACEDFIVIDHDKMRKNYNILISLFQIKLSEMASFVNYDTSYLSRIKNGYRQPSDPYNFAADISKYIARKHNTREEKIMFAKLLHIDEQDIEDDSDYYDRIINWFYSNISSKNEDSIPNLLRKIGDFDLGKYAYDFQMTDIDDVHITKNNCDVTSKSYLGFDEQLQGELDFLKATIAFNDSRDIFMYTSMPIVHSYANESFKIEYMRYLKYLLNQGKKFTVVHDIDRPIDELLYGIERWFPIYMTGNISPYYIKGVHNKMFRHAIYVSGGATLKGDCIDTFEDEGKYYLSTDSSEIEYVYKKASNILTRCAPLMEIYTEQNQADFSAFLLSNAKIKAERKVIWSSLPIYTMKNEHLKDFLDKRNISSSNIKKIKNYVSEMMTHLAIVLPQNKFYVAMPFLSEEEFNKNLYSLQLAEIFFDEEIVYTYDEYLTHFADTLEYTKEHGIELIINNEMPFKNVQIISVSGNHVIISKEKNPCIHFVIKHSRLRDAVENIMVKKYLI